jgi:hypothetical protein
MSNAGRGPAAEDPTVPKEGRAREALRLMAEALTLIDANDGPDDAGAYLDQAIHRLRDWIDRASSK